MKHLTSNKIAMAAMVAPVVATAVPMDGIVQEVKASEVEVIEIHSAIDLNNIRNDLTANYILMNDIDLSGINWQPTEQFTGTLDGNGHTISNLTIANQDYVDYVGLFGMTEGATIKNLTLENPNITNGESYRYTGALVGYTNSSTIENVGVEGGSVTGGVFTGGLVGRNVTSSSITNAYATSDVTGGDYTGGLAGYNGYSSSITNAYATGDVTGGKQIGGLVGYNGYSSSITNAYATGDVSGTTNTGGLVGLINDSSITNAYATGDVTGRNSTGGLVGYSIYFSSITNAYAIGSVNGTNNVGGLAGYISSSTVEGKISTGTVKNAFALNTSVAGTNSRSVGKAIGNNEGKTSNITAISTISGTSHARDVHQTINPVQALQQTTFGTFNFDDIWSIDEEETLPYLVDMPYKVNYDPETGSWVDPNKDDDSSGVIENPSEATAEDLINDGYENVVPENESEYQSAFEKYENDVDRTLTKDDIQNVIDAINGVIEAENNPTSDNISDALDKVNDLENGGLKDDLTDRLEALLSPPTNFDYEAINDSSINLKWDNILVGATYVLKRDGEIIYQGTDLSFVDENLTRGKEYTYSVSTKVQELSSDESSLSVILEEDEDIEIEKPNAVKDIKFDNITYDSFDMSWDANGNPEGTEYKTLIKYRGMIILDSGWMTETSGKAINLDPGIEYTVEVIARNSEWVESEVTSATVQTDGYQISPIENLRAIKSENGKVILEWDHFKGEDAHNIEYIIEKSRGYTQYPSIKVTTNRFEDNDVEVGKGYTYTVKAHHTKYGIESDSQTVTAYISIPDAPAAIDNFLATKLDDDSYEFTWDHTEGASLYYLEVFENNKRKVLETTKSTEITINKLEKGKEYDVSVYAVDKYGQQSDKTTLTLETEAAPIVNITDFNIDVDDDNNVTLSWDEVNGALRYDVEKYKDGKRLSRTSVTDTSYVDKNVKAGDYEYRVHTYHETGMLDPVSKTVTIEEIEEEIVELELNVEVNENNVKLSWNEIPSAYNYFVYRYDEDGKRKLYKSTRDISITEENLDAGKYVYEVVVYGKNGLEEPVQKEFTIEESSIENRTDILNPDSVELDIDGNNVTLTWDTVDDVYSYFIYRYNENGVRKYYSITTEPKIEEKGIPSGTYKYEIVVYSQFNGLLEPFEIEFTIK